MLGLIINELGMIMKFTFEQIEKIMEHPLVNGKIINVDSYGFSREFEFTANNHTYNIIWYHNQSTLIIDDLHVMFHSIELSNTWPSPAGAKLKMQFIDTNGNCVAALPIEWYENDE